MDAYFKRVNDIIKKGMVSPRLRFMLQGVVELRDNKWIPHTRQQQQSKASDECGIKVRV